MKSLYRSLILTLFVLVGCGLGSKINQKVYDMEVKQVEKQNTRDGLVITRELTFSDFQSPPSTSEGYKHTMGLTVAKLEYTHHSPNNYNGKVYYKFSVNARFIPEKSWIRFPDDSATLQHEQIHYDIYKVAARELRQLLSASAYDEVNYRQEMRDIFTRVQQKYEIIQSQFDIGDQRDTSNNRLWKSKVNEAIQKGHFEVQ